MFMVEMDGMMYWELMMWELINVGVWLLLLYGVVVVGLWEWVFWYVGDELCLIMWLMLLNGWGVLFLFKLLDVFSVDMLMVIGYELLDGEDWIVDFSVGVMEYESCIMVVNDVECDVEIGCVLVGFVVLFSE